MEHYFFYLTYNFIYQLQNHFLGYQCPRYYHRYHSLFPVTSWYHMDSSNHIPTSWQHQPCWSHQYPSPSTLLRIDLLFFMYFFVAFEFYFVDFTHGNISFFYLFYPGMRWYHYWCNILSIVQMHRNTPRQRSTRKSTMVRDIFQHGSYSHDQCIS